MSTTLQESVLGVFFLVIWDFVIRLKLVQMYGYFRGEKDLLNKGANPYYCFSNMDSGCCVRCCFSCSCNAFEECCVMYCETV